MIDLNAIKAEIAQLRQLIATEDDPQLWLDMLEGQGFNEVMEQLLTRRQEALELIAGMKARITEINIRKGRQEMLVERLEAAMHTLLQLAGLNAPLRLPEATLSIRDGSEHVEIDDIEALPSEYVKVEKSAVKADIMKALKAGKIVPGAHKERGSSSLSIKTK